MKKKKQPSIWQDKTIKLCYLSALKDKDGNVYTDDKGRIQSFSSFPGLSVKVIPNPDSKGDWCEYILCIGPQSTILPGLGDPLEDDHESDGEKE